MSLFYCLGKNPENKQIHLIISWGLKDVLSQFVYQSSIKGLHRKESKRGCLADCLESRIYTKGRKNQKEKKMEV